MDCDNCKHKTCWEYAEPCSSCTDMTGVPTNWEPQTNADRIRAMTDEELAKLFLAHDEQLYRHCPSDKRAEDCYADLGKAFDACEKCWLDWLKSPEVDNGT